MKYILTLIATIISFLCGQNIAKIDTAYATEVILSPTMKKLDVEVYEVIYTDGKDTIKRHFIVSDYEIITIEMFCKE